MRKVTYEILDIQRTTIRHMLSDFSKAKKNFRRDISRFTCEKLRSSGIRKPITNKRAFEGHRLASSYRIDPADSSKSSFKQVEHLSKVTPEAIIQRGPELFVEISLDAAGTFEAEQNQMIVDDINTAIDNTGNTVLAKEVTQESLLAMLEKMYLSFNSQDQPNLQLVLFPTAAVKRQEILSWNQDQEFKDKFDQVIVKKRLEWRELESKRKLVD